MVDEHREDVLGEETCVRSSKVAHLFLGHCDWNVHAQTSHHLIDPRSSCDDDTTASKDTLGRVNGRRAVVVGGDPLHAAFLTDLSTVTPCQLYVKGVTKGCVHQSTVFLPLGDHVVTAVKLRIASPQLLGVPPLRRDSSLRHGRVKILDHPLTWGALLRQT